MSSSRWSRGIRILGGKWVDPTKRTPVLWVLPVNHLLRLGLAAFYGGCKHLQEKKVLTCPNLVVLRTNTPLQKNTGSFISFTLPLEGVQSLILRRILEDYREMTPPPFPLFQVIDFGSSCFEDERVYTCAIHECNMIFPQVHRISEQQYLRSLFDFLLPLPTFTTKINHSWISKMFEIHFPIYSSCRYTPWKINGWNLQPSPI